MKNEPLEAYFATLEKRLKCLSPVERTAEIGEVRQHLEALKRYHLQQGASESEATRLALQKFGKAEAVGAELSRAWRQNRFKSKLRSAARYCVFWLGLTAVQFLFFAAMNDKSSDFPYGYGEQLLLAISFANIGLCGNLAYRKVMRKSRLNST
jgi:hypothetical protein